MPNGTSPKAKATARRYLKKTAKDRAKRNAARNAAIKAGRARKGDGKEVDHTGSPGRGPTGATRVISSTKNRGWRKGRKGKR